MQDNNKGYDIKDKLSEVEKAAGYNFKNKELLRQAFVHSSYANENPGVLSNERLEFLGDAVLEFVISGYIYNHFPKCTEGELTKLRATIVCEGNLSKAAAELNLGDYLKLGVGEANSSGSRQRSSTLCDVFEALIGAIFLDGGIESVGRFITKHAVSRIDLTEVSYSPNDYKGQLQELLQKENPPKNGQQQIIYKILSQTGPAHNRLFSAQAEYNGSVLGTGSGKSKKEAEQNSAYDAICKLERL